MVSKSSWVKAEKAPLVGRPGPVSGSWHSDIGGRRAPSGAQMTVPRGLEQLPKRDLLVCQGHIL